MSLFVRQCQMDLSLYLVTERASVRSPREFFRRVRQGVGGGVTCVQLREPDPQVCLRAAIQLRKIVPPSVGLIINDHVDVARKTKAGLHIGQKDIPYKEARRLLGPQAVIGLTVNSLDDVRIAETLDVDYLGVQVFYSERTKPEQTQVWGLEGLRQVRSLSRHRLVAIGGINLANLQTVYSQLVLGEDGIAMVGELWRGDPYAEAQKIRSVYNQMRELQH